jgi:hypothetical protein
MEHDSLEHILRTSQNRIAISEQHLAELENALKASQDIIFRSYKTIEESKTAIDTFVRLTRD